MANPNRYIHYDPILTSILSSYNKQNEEEIHVVQSSKSDVKESDTNSESLSSLSSTVTPSPTTATNTRVTSKTIYDTNEVIKEKRNETGRAKWNTVKSIIRNTANNEDQDTNNTSSLIAQELAFLNMRKEYSASNKDDQQKTNLSKAKDSFRVVVDAAIARARLRQDLSMRLSRLTIKEAQFLKELVDDENVTKQQLEHADYVLNTDPLYKLPGETSTIKSIMSGEGLETRQEEDLMDVLEGHRVYIDGKNIEILLNWDEYSTTVESPTRISCIRRRSMEMTKSIDNFPSHPSTFSYKTWTKDSIMSSVLGLPDEFDEAAQVLSPPMIKSLRKSLPFVVAEDYFWLKYAMTRDGSSLTSLYDSIRQSSRTLLAIETVNGEVFGAFVSSPWRNYSSFYGSCEAFLWRLNKSRFTPTNSVEEQMKLESSVEIFKWSQENRNIQMSDKKKLVIGGGFPDDDSEDDSEWGLGIALGADLYEGTTSKCCTFKSPGLSQESPKGEIFEVANMEVWVSVLSLLLLVVLFYILFSHLF